MRAPLEILVVVKDTLRVRLARTSWAGRVGAVVVVGCLGVGGALVVLNGSGADRAGGLAPPGPGRGAPSDSSGRDAADDAATALNLGVGREDAPGDDAAAPVETGAEGDGPEVGATVAEAATIVDGGGGPPSGTGQDGAAAEPPAAPEPEGAAPAAPTSSTSAPPSTSPPASTTTTTTATTTTAPSDGGGGGLLGGLLGLLLGHG